MCINGLGMRLVTIWTVAILVYSPVPPLPPSHTHTHTHRLGQSQETALGHNTDTYRARMEAFGWHAIVVDGHDIEALCKGFHDAATTKEKPTCFIAKAYKGWMCMCVCGGGGGEYLVTRVNGYRERAFGFDAGYLADIMTFFIMPSFLPSFPSLLPSFPPLLLSFSSLPSLLLPGRGFPGIEDEENWHGKPLGGKAQAALDAVNALIKNQGPHGISPLPFKDDAPPVVLPQVKLSNPPNYKLGDKVRTVYQ